jgi:hypothetical protein
MTEASTAEFSTLLVSLEIRTKDDVTELVKARHDSWKVSDVLSILCDEAKGTLKAPEPKVVVPEVIKKLAPMPFLCGSHMKSADELLAVGIYPEFPEGTTSLLSKFCTPEIFAQL